MTYSEAVTKATTEQLEKGNLYLFGQDIKTWGGQGEVFKDLNAKYPDKIFDTPIAESAVAGIATGMAMTGKHVLVEYGFLDFLLHSADQIVNNASKINYLSNGAFHIPVTYYATISSDRGYGATHSQSLENMFMKVPGLEVVFPSNPTDAYDLLTLSLESKSPTLFLNHKLLLNEETEYPSMRNKKARVLTEGNELTIVTYGRCVKMVMQAVKNLRVEGIEIIDLRSLNPIDFETVKESALKTESLLTIEEGYGIVGAEVIAAITEGDKEHIATYRLNSEFDHLGVNRYIEEEVLVTTEKIIEKLKQIL